MKKNQQITVFGATGFLGRHIVRRLAKTGAIIRIPTRCIDKALPLKPMGDVGQIVPMPLSTRSDAAVAEAIGNSDAVINLIGILFEKGKNSFQSIHVETAARIARVAKERGASRLIHMSALGALPGSLAAYARSKAAGEQAVRTFFGDATILRPSIVYGAEDNFFNQFSRMANISPFLPLINGGVTKFQPIFVGDVADAVCAALTRDDARGQTYELGGAQVYTFREMLELMLRVTHRKRCFINMSYATAKLQATFMEMLPTPPLTRDQVDLLRADNVIRQGNNHRETKTLADLGITPAVLEAVLPTYL